MTCDKNSRYILQFSVYIMKSVVKIQDKDLLQTNILFSSSIASTSIQLPANAEVNNTTE